MERTEQQLEGANTPLDLRTVLEGFRDLGNPPADPTDQQLACDPGFNRYSAYWTLGPTLDAVNHAIEGMSLLDREATARFVRENRAALRTFVGNHFDSASGRFYTNSSERTRGILAWQAGIGTVKALCQAVDAIADEPSSGLAGERRRPKSPGHELLRAELLATERIQPSFDPVDGALALLADAYEDGAFVENPEIPLLPTLTALHMATLVLWNLDCERLKPLLSKVGDLQEIERFIWDCLKSRDVGGRTIAAFTIHPDVEELCVNTTSFGLQLLQHLGLDLQPEMRPRMIDFLLLAYRDGGCSSTLWEPRSLNATFFGLRAMRLLMDRESEWPAFAKAHAHEIIAFVRSCASASNGFRFTADVSRYRENCLATRYAIQILQLLGREAADAKAELDRLRTPALTFLRRQYAGEGGFRGYPRTSVAAVAEGPEWVDRFLDEKDGQFIAAVTGEVSAPLVAAEPELTAAEERISRLYADLANLAADPQPLDPVREAQRIRVSRELEELLEADVQRLRAEFEREYQGPIDAALRDLEAAKSLLARHDDPAADH